MSKLSQETESLCPACLKRISARRVSENGNVYLEKECPEHGPFKTLIWRGTLQDYIDWGECGEEAVGPLKSITPVRDGCPYDCGLCPEHKANACTMVMNVTQRCNLKCPVCFASTNAATAYEPDLETIRRMYESVLEVTGLPTIQLSGGEPTVRDDLPEIVALGKHIGFQHIMVNSNGVRIAKDRDYLRRLADAGAGTIYLQFDGVTDEVYRYTRGADLFDLKERAISNCTDFHLGVVLVPTLVPGVNDHQLGDIIRFAKGRIPTVRGVHFQPISYIGRFPAPPTDEDRITIPDLIRGLERQTKGEIKGENLMPRRSQDSHCSFSAIFVLRDGRLEAIGRRRAKDGAGRRGDDRRPPWETARSFMNAHWQPKEEKLFPPATNCNCWGNLYREVAAQGLTISCMPFQDVWSIDLDRLKRCCGHVVAPDCKIYPFCAYYLTSSTGQRLYPEVIG